MDPDKDIIGVSERLNWVAESFGLGLFGLGMSNTQSRVTSSPVNGYVKIKRE